MDNDILLRMEKISKYYSQTRVLTEVDFEVRSGEVHALVGENGAGKSTLIKILSGNVKAEEGQIYFGGTPVSIDRAFDAHELGITTVYQELSQGLQLSIAENVFMGRLPLKKLHFVDKKKLYADTRALMNQIDIDIDPSLPLNRLSIAQRQMVEILKAISFNAKLVVFDEPTSSLSQEETERLFQIIKTLKQKGVSIIYISHRMSEIEELSDRITVLRDGCVIGTVNTGEVSMQHIINMMVGRDMSNLYPKAHAAIGEEKLRVEHLSSEDVTDISFVVHAGEILGFGGLVGAGRTELMQALIGIKKHEGKIYIEEKETRIHSIHDSIRYGISYLTEDRKDLGIIPDFSISKNITVSTLQEHSSAGFMNAAKEKTTADTYYNQLQVASTMGTQTQVKNLSGGNQQKVMLARCLASHPKILILDEPTRGVDVGAKAEIYEIIGTLAQQGAAIIMVSSDMPELIAMSDRVAVMCEGRMTGVLEKADIDEFNVMRLSVRS